MERQYSVFSRGSYTKYSSNNSKLWIEWDHKDNTAIQEQIRRYLPSLIDALLDDDWKEMYHCKQRIETTMVEQDTGRITLKMYMR